MLKTLQYSPPAWQHGDFFITSIYLPLPATVSTSYLLLQSPMLRTSSGIHSGCCLCGTPRYAFHVARLLKPKPPSLLHFLPVTLCSRLPYLLVLSHRLALVYSRAPWDRGSSSSPSVPGRFPPFVAVTSLSSSPSVPDCQLYIYIWF